MWQLSITAQSQHPFHCLCYYAYPASAVFWSPTASPAMQTPLFLPTLPLASSSTSPLLHTHPHVYNLPSKALSLQRVNILFSLESTCLSSPQILEYDSYCFCSIPIFFTQLLLRLNRSHLMIPHSRNRTRINNNM